MMVLTTCRIDAYSCALMLCFWCCACVSACALVSEYPQDSLDVPSAPEQQRLNSWQETHARLILQRVQQLQDLRFVLCPKCVRGFLCSVRGVS